MCPVCIASTAVIVAGAGSAGGILAVCIGDIGKRAVQSSILDFEGGCVLVDAIAALSLGRTGREGACSLGRAREHRYDSKPQHPEGLSGIRCAGHPQWNGERRGGHLPRSDVGGHCGGLVQRCGQGTGTPVRRLHAGEHGEMIGQGVNKNGGGHHEYLSRNGGRRGAAGF